MDHLIGYQDAYDKIAPIVDRYVKQRYPDGCTMQTPDPDAINAMVEEIRGTVIDWYPELDDTQPPPGEEVGAAFCGCGGIIWLILIGALIGQGCGRCRCGRRSCCRRCGCCEKCCRCGR